MTSTWRRSTRSKPCPVCGRPNGQQTSTWCTFSPDGEMAICPFTPDGAKRYIEDAGYLHRLNGNHRKPSTYRMAVKPLARVVNWDVLADFYAKNTKAVAVGELAAGLGLSVESLRRLGIGWDGVDAWTFPMRDATGKIIGIRTRTPIGKRAVRGSRNGLFIPAGVKTEGMIGGVVLVCEGPTDTAKATDIGFAAIGRASANTCETLIRDYLGNRPAVVMADADDTGRHYAWKLARKLSCPVITPRHGKDLRQWSPTCQELLDTINTTAIPTRPTI